VAGLESRQDDFRREAKIALARMSVKPYFDDFISDLSSPDKVRRYGSIRALGEIKDKRAVKHLVAILDDDSNPAPRTTSFASRAAGSLGEILPAAWAQIKAQSGKTYYFPEKDWKAWWVKNKSDFEKL